MTKYHVAITLCAGDLATAIMTRVCPAVRGSNCQGLGLESSTSLTSGKSRVVFALKKPGPMSDSRNAAIGCALSVSGTSCFGTRQ
jgi:hypothetical protein